ncbi:MAG: DUF484 family protein [Gammaproteobacteria bacterium]|nr:DUF484 family protein [Gammaproteobacteria bacterium]MBQ0838436.1 DUF484 family protein [Gammaproteobacteria bacterium]
MSTKDKSGKQAARLITEQQVCEFLSVETDFFDRHPELLESLELPHESGKAVSLIERQISVLRERNLEMRSRLNNLLETARANDKLFEKTKRLVLALLETATLSKAIDTLYDSLKNDFQIEHHKLILFSTENSIKTPAKIVSLDQGSRAIGGLLRSNRATCGVLRDEELSFLFEDQAAAIKSVAVVPLNNGNTFGVLAIGSSDPLYYKSSMGTLFLSYIAEVLNRIVPPMMEQMATLQALSAPQKIS